MLFRPIPMATDDTQCSTNANLLDMCAMMLPYLSIYDRDDLRSQIVHRTRTLYSGKFSVSDNGRKHRCGKISLL